MPVRVAAVAIALAITGCDAGADSASSTRRAEGSVRVVTLERRSFSSAIAAIGAVKPQVGAEVRVGARISGRVERLHANIKDQVRKGQLLAELEKTELESAVKHRQGEMHAVEARRAAAEKLFPSQLAQAHANQDRWTAITLLASRESERFETLLRGGLVSRTLAEESEQRLVVAQAELAIAREEFASLRNRHATGLQQLSAELDGARALVATAEAQLSYATIVAPISGVIGSVSTQEGETVAAGLNAPTFVTIVDLDRLMIEAYVDEVDIGKVGLNQRATFGVDAFPAMEFEGRVVAVYPKATIHDNVVKYVVALEVTTAYAGRLRPEMTATIAIHLEPREVLAIPSKSVRREAGRSFVYLATDSGPKRRDVTLGWRDGGWTEIAAGLKEGDTVLLSVPTTVE